MNRVVIYIHGKGGSAKEAEQYKTLFKDSDVIGFDYTAQTPWEAKEEFPTFFDSICQKYESVIIIANSIGAFFAMNSLYDQRIEKAFYLTDCRYGSTDHGYDDMGRCNRRGASY